MIARDPEHDPDSLSIRALAWIKAGHPTDDKNKK